MMAKADRCRTEPMKVSTVLLVWHMLWLVVVLDARQSFHSIAARRFASLSALPPYPSQWLGPTARLWCHHRLINMEQSMASGILVVVYSKQRPADMSIKTTFAVACSSGPDRT